MAVAPEVRFAAFALAVTGAASTIIFAFLPWAEVSADQFAPTSFNGPGIGGQAYIMVALAVAAVVGSAIGFVGRQLPYLLGTWSRRTEISLLIDGLGIVAVALTGWSSAVNGRYQNTVTHVPATNISVTAQYGLPVAMVGGALIALAGLILLLTRASTRSVTARS